MLRARRSCRWLARVAPLLAAVTWAGMPSAASAKDGTPQGASAALPADNAAQPAMREPASDDTPPATSPSSRTPPGGTPRAGVAEGSEPAAPGPAAAVLPPSPIAAPAVVDLTAASGSTRLGPMVAGASEEPRPLLERWWFWTAVAAVGVTAFVIVTASASARPPQTELGNRVAF